MTSPEDPVETRWEDALKDASKDASAGPSEETSEKASEDPRETELAAETFDPGQRRLCPDGACVGLVDNAGRCQECGRFWGPDAPGSAPRVTHADEPDSESPAASFVAPSGGFDPNRRLCPDGTCVGVLGADDACSVCGRRYQDLDDNTDERQ
jgi:hypothetical protein